MSDAGKNRRERAAAAQQAANTAEKKRERMVRIVGAVTVLVVVVAIIAVAVVAKNSASSTATDSSAVPVEDTSAVLPAGVIAAGEGWAYGVPFNPGVDAPVLEIWEDFQCPACQALEKANGEGIQSLAEAGKIKLIYRPTTFLDKNLGNDSSARAIAAWGCAIDAGKGPEFHNTVYSNPPANEGDGFTDDQLIAFAKQTGITGTELDGFTKCFQDRVYAGWATNSTAIFYSAKIQGTPYGILDGKEVPTATLANQAALEKLVADTAAGVTSSAAASPAAS